MSIGSDAPAGINRADGTSTVRPPVAASYRTMSVPPPTASSSVVYASPDASHFAGPNRSPKKSRDAKMRWSVRRPGSEP